MTLNWGLIQLCIFLTAFGALVAAEHFWPRRVRSIELVTRWSANMGFTVVNAATGMAMNFFVPFLMVGEALYLQSHGYGLFPAIGVGGWVGIAISCAALDLTLYSLHVATHRVPLLWRFHRVHHVDLEVDATTAFRAHPLEYAISQVSKAATIFLLGAPAIAVVIYEILLNLFAMFSHSNIRLDETTDRALRRLIVTPDMHRVHHSSYQPETDSNYGVVTPLWDRLFGTYTAATREPQTSMKLGLDEVRGREATNLFWLLAYPFMANKPPAFDTPVEQMPQIRSTPNGGPRAAVTTSLHTPA